MTKLNNLFIFVTQGKTVFDRTGGKNTRIFPGKRYNVRNGSVEILLEEGKLFITRFSENGALSYRKEITESGLYVVHRCSFSR